MILDIEVFGKFRAHRFAIPDWKSLHDPTQCGLRQDERQGRSV